MPAASGVGPTGPTVVIAHGWGSNKSAMLDRAAVLHDAYNLLMFDLRNHGQSDAAATTQGVREAKRPRGDDRLAGARRRDPTGSPTLGVSMGGATALAEADRDERIDARHRRVDPRHPGERRRRRGSIGAATRCRCRAAGRSCSASLVRTGEDVSAVDPVQTVERLDERPLLIIYAGQDGSIGPDDAEAILAAAEAAGSPAELQVCADCRPRRVQPDLPGGLCRLGARLPRARPGTGQLRRSARI